MIRLQRLGHVLMAVRNLEASKKFYIDLLGFRLLEQDPEHGGVFLSIGEYGNTLDLFPSTAPDDGGPSAMDGKTLPGLGVKHVAFAVATEADLEDAYFTLDKAGVKIFRALDHQSQKSLYLHDPDGNLIEIVWERPDARDIFARGRSDGDTELSFKR